MSSKIHKYAGQGIIITYDVKRCIHAAECVRGLPSVFDANRRPWIEPAAATADEIAAVIRRCPTGALHYERTDGALEEAPPEQHTINIVPDGPLYIQGTIEIRAPDGTLLHRDTRVALCRCGASANKPFCDNSHRQVGFVDPGTAAD